MASKGIQDILGWVALTKAVNAVKDGVPNPLMKYLFTVRPDDKIVGDSVKYNAMYGMRKTARTVRYGSPPRHRANQREELREMKFLSFSEERTFDPYVLQVLRDYQEYTNADKAKRLVANNIKTLGTLFGNARIVAVATTLARGAIYDDANGNLLPTSSGAANTYSHLIPAANIGSVTATGGGTIFGATGGGSWALNSTNIPLQLDKLDETAAADHGYEPRVALYGKSTKTNLITNDFVLDFLARNVPIQTEYLKDNTIPAGLFGKIWVAVHTLSYTDDADAKQLLWPNDGVTFLPGEEDLASWWSMFEGSNLIPTTIDIIPDAMSALASLETVHGAAGYSVVSHKPVSLSVVMLDTFWPGIKLPEVVYVADVVA